MIVTIGRRASAGVACLVLGVAAAGCGLLDVSDPTAVEETELANASSADLMRRNALARLYLTVAEGVLSSGLVSDEFMYDQPPASSFEPAYMQMDRREMRTDDATALLYEGWHRTRREAGEALLHLRRYGATATRQAYVGQMLAVRGYATLQLAEQFCAGFPLHDVVDGRVTLGPPLTSREALEAALADFDSAAAYVADSARLLQLVEAGRARTLVGLGRYAEAAQRAASVLTAFVWHMEFTTSGVYQTHLLLFGQFGDLSRSVADREGGTGLDFVSASDPRAPTIPLGTAHDGVTGLYGSGKYPTETAPIVLASGIEARLIEAEAALQSDDARWLAILNDLRQTQVTPAMPMLADPGTPTSRADLLFRERAFWLFGTGHRLGDLRRLVQQYGRAPENVFPTGIYRLGGAYGAAASLPFPVAAEAAYNPAVTGCTGS